MGIKRRTIGIVFSYNENWIGGTYYILNLIRALSYIDDEQKPKICILNFNKNSKKGIENIDYPYLQVISVQKTLFSRVLRKSISFLFNKSKSRLNRVSFKKSEEIDLVFPSNFNFHVADFSNQLFWIPDFQHKEFPEFFSAIEIDNRNNKIEQLISQKSNIVFSSENAKSHFNLHYPINSCKQYILQFAVSHEDFSHVKIQDLRNKYDIQGEYYICSNQFWKHKNHFIVLEALSLLKASGDLNFKLVFTGKQIDLRDKSYFHKILAKTKSFNIENDVCYLGFIDRLDQLQIMNNSKAVIQPSLFEGWGTVIEDAKCLNKVIFASDIPIHREQLNDNGYYFDKDNAMSLASLIRNHQLNAYSQPNFKYDEKVLKFGSDFLKISSAILNDEHNL